MGINSAGLNFLINERCSLISQEIQTIAKNMGIPQETIRTVNLDFDLASLNCLRISISSQHPPSKKRQYALLIPLPYLIEPLDLEESHPLYQLIAKVQSFLPPEEQDYLFFFLKLLETGHFKSMRTFILSHELAHLANGDCNFGSENRQGIPLFGKPAPLYSFQKEKRADPTAAAISGLTHAGIEFMQIASEHLTDSPLHPPWKKRAAYLEKFAQRGRSYLWKEVNKSSQRLGDPPVVPHSPFSRSSDRALSPFQGRPTQVKPQQNSLTFDQEVEAHRLHFPHECLLDQID